jgi:hypothetical protein
MLTIGMAVVAIAKACVTPKVIAKIKSGLVWVTVRASSAKLSIFP